MFDQLQAVVQLLCQCLRIAETVGNVPLGAIKADDAADTTHDGK